MRKFVCLQLLLCAAFCLRLSVAKAQLSADVLHYRFEIEVNDSHDSIAGNATLTVLFLKPVNDFTLDLVTQKKNGSGMIVDKISGPGVRGFQKTAEQVRILFSESQSPRKNDTARFIITYHGKPADGMVISKNKFGRRTFFADNWPNRAHHWIPCVDDPADKAPVEFIVTAPVHYQVVSNGVQVEETNLPGEKKRTHYRETIPLPTKIMVIGVAEFAVATAGEQDCAPVTSWVFPENRDAGFYDYAVATEVLAWHSNYIAPYPYKKLANVQSKTMFGGMENAGAIFYEEGSVTGDRQSEELISHEIVHQWFGNMATEKSFAHFWLSEGFATYLTHLYLESKYGTNKFQEGLRADRDKVLAFVKSARRPVVDSTAEYMRLLNANSYQKGSWVLHMLRRQLGDPVFHQCIREYYRLYAGRNADSRDFQEVAETVSGKKLETFFNQWLYRPENPSLSLHWKYDPDRKKVTGTIRQLQAGSFTFPLQLAFISPSGAITLYTQQVTQRETGFSFSMGEKPAQLLADPFTDLLAEMKVTELK